METAQPQDAPKPKPNVYDIAKIRKAYNRVQAALTQAKEAGNQELAEKYRADYLALKQMLADAKESQAQGPESADLSQENRELKERLAKAEETFRLQRATIADLKYKLELAEDEVRTLRAPVPAKEYQNAQRIPPNALQYSFTMSDVDAEMMALK